MASTNEPRSPTLRQFRDSRKPHEPVLTEEGARTVAAFIYKFAADGVAHEVAADILAAVATDCAYEPNGAMMGLIYQLPEQFSQNHAAAWLILDAKEVEHRPS